MNVDSYSDCIDDFLHRLPSGSKILDIACGPGNIANYILGKRPDLNWTGVDGAESMVKLARQLNPQATFQVIDCRDMKIKSNAFQAIICSFILPYLNKQEAKKLIIKIVDGLVTDGLLYISTTLSPGRKAHSSNTARIQPEYHSEQDILTWFSNTSFKVIKKVYYKNEITADKELVIIAIKKSRM